MNVYKWGRFEFPANGGMYLIWCERRLIHLFICIQSAGFPQFKSSKQSGLLSSPSSGISITIPADHVTPRFYKTLAAVPLAFALDDPSAAAAPNIQANWDSIDARRRPSGITMRNSASSFTGVCIRFPSFALVNVKGETPYAEWYWNSLNQRKERQAESGCNGESYLEFHKTCLWREVSVLRFRATIPRRALRPRSVGRPLCDSGAKYVALTSKHHEGFTLWRSQEANRAWGRPWNAVEIGPKRDLLLDLMEAGRRKGLHMGIYYSLYEWYNPLWLSDRKRYVSGASCFRSSRTS